MLTARAGEPLRGTRRSGRVAAPGDGGEAHLSAGTALAVLPGMIDAARLELTDLWCRAMDAHDQQPLTSGAALAAAAVAHEDRRRRGAGIPSIFDLSAPGIHSIIDRSRRGSPGRGLR